MQDPTFDRIIFFLRIALGVLFFWFGVLKLFGFNPVYEIVYASFPFLAHGFGNFALGTFEAVIGIVLILNVAQNAAHVALAGHLLGTLSVFVLSPSLMFDPYFPALSLSGEFVFKNIILLLAGFVILRYNQIHRPHA